MGDQVESKRVKKEQAVPTSLDALKERFGDQILEISHGVDMPTVVFGYTSIVEACHFLKQQGFEQLIDLCGVDMSEYPGHDAKAPRFQVVYHLLSIQHNQRLRLKVPVDERDLVGSVVRCGRPPTGLSARPSICMASCS